MTIREILGTHVSRTMNSSFISPPAESRKGNQEISLMFLKSGPQSHGHTLWHAGQSTPNWNWPWFSLSLADHSEPAFGQRFILKESMQPTFRKDLSFFWYSPELQTTVMESQLDIHFPGSLLIQCPSGLSFNVTTSDLSTPKLDCVAFFVFP